MKCVAITAKEIENMQTSKSAVICPNLNETCYISHKTQLFIMDLSTLAVNVHLGTINLSPTRCSVPLLVPTTHLQLILEFAFATMDRPENTSNSVQLK